MLRRPPSLDLRRLRPPRRTDGIAAQLRDLILRGAMRPGERLPSERELAWAWRVGRPTVREAMQQLDGLGFVEVRAARGSFVRSLVPHALEEPLRRIAAEETRVVAQILDVRMALEGWVAAEAARSAPPEQRRRIARIVDGLSTAAERAEPLSELDAAFHRAIVEATGNTVMLHPLESLASLGASAPAFKRRIGFRQTRPRAFTACHREVARAIIARDPERARSAMVSHLEMVKRMLMATAAEEPTTVGTRGRVQPGRHIRGLERSGPRRATRRARRTSSASSTRTSPGRGRLLRR